MLEVITKTFGSFTIPHTVSWKPVNAKITDHTSSGGFICFIQKYYFLFRANNMVTKTGHYFKHDDC